MKNNFLICIVLTISLALPSVAYAYLDPGTGSVLVQGLLAGFAGVLAVLKLYWQRIKNFFKHRFLGKTSNTQNAKTNNEADSN